jgi:amino acid adenylation domain-containing protein
MGQERHRLSFGQEQLWFVNQMFPDESVYNVTLASRLRGPLDTAALGEALTAVVAQDEMLRATFGSEDGVPFQTVRPAEAVRLSLRDAPADPAELDRLIEAAAAEPFDLATGPLYRFLLLRVAPEDHVFVRTIHHIVVDGLSMGLVNQHISVAYAAFLHGERPQLPTAPCRYFDYVEQQRDSLDDRLLADQLGFWAERLDGLSVLDLPTDRPRPPSRGLRGTRLSVDFSDELAGSLRELAQLSGMPLFAPLLAGVQAVLARYTGQEDVPVGVTMFGRQEPEWESVVGFFVNMVVLRGDLSDDPTMLEIVERTGNDIFDAYEYDQVPFEKVVERVAPVRDPSRNPLFQVAVQVLTEDNAGQDLNLTGVAAEPLHTAVGGSRFDLTLSFVESATTLRVDIEYASDLFDQWRIEALAGHLERVLTEAADEPSRRLSELGLLADTERDQVLAFGKGEPSSRTPLPVHAVLASIAADRPDLLAATCRGRTLTYGELDRRADLLARYLRTLGVGHEDIVAVAMDRDLDVLVALFGILKAGAAYTFLDPKQPANRLEYILTDTAAPVVLTRSGFVAGLPARDGRRMVCLDTEWPLIESVPTTEPLVELATRDSLIYVLYTSGSTGRPKGVLLEHRALMSFAESYQRDFALGPGERVMQSRPLTFDMSHGEIIATLTSGAALVLVPEDVVTSPEALAELIEQERVTYVGIPTTLLALVDAGPYPDVRSVMNGGEAVPGELVNKWNLPGRRFVNAYGPTEAAVACTGYVCEHTAWHSVPPIGTPYLDRQLYVVDRHQNLTPVGVPGELLVGGDEGLARGYLNQPAMTDERFVPDPVRPGGRVYRTGDLVRWNRHGRLEFLGRRDSQIKLRGQRIELEEIEATLAAHPGVAMAAVSLRTDTHGDQQLVGYVTSSGSRTPTARELREHVSGFLPAYMVPAAWQVLTEFPLNSAKKIDRGALPAPDLALADPAIEVTAPRTDTEVTVVGVFAEVLGVPTVSVDDNFFMLGGTSIQGMRVISRINRAFGVKVNVRLLYGTATVATIAARIDELLAGASTASPR